MARLTEYNYDNLKEHKGVDVIYGLYTDDDGIRYIGYSKDVYNRFKSHLRNDDYNNNIHKKKWINKNKGLIKIKLISINPPNWEKEEIYQIKKHNNLLNICQGGKNNIHKKDFKDLTNEEHLLQANKALRELNNYYKSIGKTRRFKLLTEKESNTILNG